ncbi:hypothetical protein H6B51_03835 [Pseudoflavonifractor phocaeensis]|nr:hypothetical protein [Pseudoflavonifractor phocaeensis]
MQLLHFNQLKQERTEGMQWEVNKNKLKSLENEWTEGICAQISASSEKLAGLLEKQKEI